MGIHPGGGHIIGAHSCLLENAPPINLNGKAITENIAESGLNPLPIVGPHAGGGHGGGQLGRHPIGAGPIAGPGTGIGIGIGPGAGALKFTGAHPFGPQ